MNSNMFVTRGLIPVNKRPFETAFAGPGMPTTKRVKMAHGSDSSDDGIDENVEDTTHMTAAEKHRKESIIHQMTHMQQIRHEAYAQSTFYKSQKKNIKNEMATISNSRISLTSVVVMCGISKVFVGEVTEMAKTVMLEWGHTGPIRPNHLREAYHRLNKEGLVVEPKTKKKLFRR